MRFHGLMLLRDENDIIVQNLNHLLSWIDSLYILDMGSVDGTWDVVMDYARRDKRIVPFFSRPIVYSDNLRCMLLNEYRSRFDPGDWVMKIDADEFYHVPPPKFVAERVRPLETAVHLQWYFFRMTLQEAADYESGRGSIAEDRKRPIEQRRRHYKVSTYAEPRMFRYRRGMQWWEHSSFPYNAGFVARQRIPIRHYPHRDPEQMRRRYQLRAAMMKLKAHAGGHWKLDDWRQELVDATGASPASQGEVKTGLAGELGIDTGPLYFWEPGKPFVEMPLQNHIPPWRMRMTQRVIHPLLLPILDRFRPRYDPAFQPTAIPPEIAANIYG
jgi:Glycosyl transferase family 2